VLTLFVVRHATHSLVGRVLAGRMAGVGLNQEGREQAQRLAARLGREKVDEVLTSPLERARETAGPIAARLNCVIHTAKEINEIDCGGWTGLSFEALSKDPRWSHWNEARAGAGAPDGETMQAVQTRAMGLVRRLAVRAGGIVLVTHSDIIKAIVAAVLGLSLDRHDSFVIDPASITTVQMFGETGRIVRMNEAVAA
jgi:broad specificity phosphatase PhoE